LFKAAIRAALDHRATRNRDVAYSVGMEALREVYAAFNARDIDAVLGKLHPDVDWPNGWEGGRVHGHAEVRNYWTRQWAAVDSSVEPVGFTETPDGRVAVEVHQLVKDLEGKVLSEDTVTHMYTFDNGLVTRMDIVA
jgi:ketosteroid isomerase-like protein